MTCSSSTTSAPEPRRAALLFAVALLAGVVSGAGRAAPGEDQVAAARQTLVRDSQGLAAALPWFGRALQNSPRDIAVLGEYAATLGDLGQAKKMLAITRLMLSIEPGNARAYVLPRSSPLAA